MPHKCTKCGRIYEEGAEEIIKVGCKCGNRFFFYFRRVEEKGEKELVKKAFESKKVVEVKRAKEFLEKELTNEKIEKLWNIRVKDGVYEIDLASLLKKEPIVVAGDDGTFLLSISSIFESKLGKGRKYIERL